MVTPIQLTNDAALLQHLMASSQTGIVLLEAVRDKSGNFVDFKFKLINPAGAAILRQTVGDLLEQSYLGYFTQAESSGLLTTYRQVLDTGTPQRLAEVAYEADNVSGWFDLQITRYGDAVLVLFTDITSLKRSSLLTQNQNQFLDGIFNASPDASFVLEAVRDAGSPAVPGPIIDFRYTHINARFEELFNVKTETIVGQLYLTLYPRVKTIGLFEHFCQIVETGRPYHQEVFYEGEGLHGWYELTVVKVNDGLLGTSKDVTARKLGELEQQQQAAFLSQVLQTTPSGIITYQSIRAVVSPQPQLLDTSSETNESPGTIIDFHPVFFNAAYESIFGDPAEVVQNRTFRERFSQESDRELFLTYRQVVETEVSFRRERYYARINKWLDLSVTKFGDGFLAIVNDITDRKRAEEGQHQQAEALRQANQELALTNENLQQFAYVASHDLQEPLRKIQAFGSLLNEQYAPALGKNGADLLGRIESAAARMSILIRDLLALSRLTTQQRSFLPLSLNATLESVLTVLDLRIQETGATIDVGPLGTVTGDATQLAQLFQNLISNALKFTEITPDRHPHIRISSRLVSRAEMPAGFQPASDSGAYQLIDVSDNGIGFSPGQAERIFAPFQRLHTKQAYPGTGIGLAIAKRVVENHKGYIRAESQPGQGATFQIYLPVHERPTESQ